MSDFSKRVRNLRLSANLSLRQLSKLTGISHSAISAYETGKREPGFESLESLCDVFNCDIDYILGRSDTKNNAANSLGFSSLYEANLMKTDLQLFAEKNAPEESKLSEDEWVLVKAFRLIPEEQQRNYLEMIRAYANSLKKD